MDRDGKAFGIRVGSSISAPTISRSYSPKVGMTIRLIFPIPKSLPFAGACVVEWRATPRLVGTRQLRCIPVTSSSLEGVWQVSTYTWLTLTSPRCATLGGGRQEEGGKQEARVG